jgi:chorismate mutase
MAARGIKGAITVTTNTESDILKETKLLLSEMLAKNKTDAEEVFSIVFSVTSDLDKQFPAVAARELGFINTPLLCTTEMPVPGSLKKVIRVIMHVNTRKQQKDIRHVYLKEAAKLRPDLADAS